MNNWEQDKRWADVFMPEVKRILGEYLIGEAPIEEDISRNTDLIVLRLEAVRIGCRIRTHQYFLNEKYRHEFTIRCERPRGTKTELAKIVEGWGNYFFYAFAGPDDRPPLQAYCLGNLSVFRLWFMREIVRLRGQAPGIVRKNHDGSSAFRVFSLNDMPDGFVIARQSGDQQ